MAVFPSKNYKCRNDPDVALEEARNKEAIKKLIKYINRMNIREENRDRLL